MPDYPPVTVVVAESHRRVRDWCLDNARDPRDRTLISVTSEHDLNRLRSLSLSRSNDTVVDLGGGPFGASQQIELRFRRA